jgi:hypothetical protein
MKIRHLVVATSAALLSSFAAVAGGGSQHSQIDQKTLAALGVGASASSGAWSEQAPRPSERPRY